MWRGWTIEQIIAIVILSVYVLVAVLCDWPPPDFLV